MEPGDYQLNEIFENPTVNQLCDLIFSKLLEKFPAQSSDPTNDFLYKGFILSGRAAAILQGETNIPLNNIVFETYQTEIYKYLQVVLPSTFKSSVIAFKERILFYYAGLYFEFWWSEDPLNEIEISGIYVQTLSNIPSPTL